MFDIDSLKIRLFTDFIGKDSFGNKYYQSRKIDHNFKSRRRFVIYSGDNESSKVPPLWHSWLHYMSDNIPSKEDYANLEWKKIHIPNTTGTGAAHDPVKNFQEAKKERKKFKDNIWTPKS